MGRDRPYRVLVDRKIGEATRRSAILALSVTSVDFSLGASDDDVASLASKVRNAPLQTYRRSSYLPERSPQDRTPVRRNGQVTFHDDGGGRPPSWSRHGRRGVVVSYERGRAVMDAEMICVPCIGRLKALNRVHSEN